MEFPMILRNSDGRGQVEAQVLLDRVDVIMLLASFTQISKRAGIVY
jgi:hypothetical protein